MLRTTETTETEEGKKSGGRRKDVIRADDYNEFDPYDDGDFKLLADAACWFLGAYDYGRREWEIGSSTVTEDGLAHTLTVMRLNEVHLAALRRLMRTADETLCYAQDERERMRQAAAKIL